MSKSTGHEGKRSLWIDEDVHAQLLKLASDQRYKTLAPFVNRILRDYVEGKIVEHDAITTTELIVGLYARREIDEQQLSVLLEKLKSGELSATAVSRRSRLILRPLKGPSDAK